MAMTYTRPIQIHKSFRPATRHLLLMCAALLAPLPAAAVGLGKVTGNPVMGEPLVLEVPLLEAGNISAECIQLSPHSTGSDSQFFPRKATLELKKKEGGTLTLISIHGAEFTQPVLEFRLTVACGFHIARDYVLLPAPSRELRYDPVPLHQPAALAVPQSPPPAVVKMLGAVAAPTSPAGPSLELMAKTRYPLQPKARAKFKQMVREANPATLADVTDDAPLPANAELQIPANIPKKRIGPYIPKTKKTPPPVPAPVPAVAETVAATAPPPPVADSTKDRLSISSGVGSEGATQPVGAADGVLQEKAAESFTSQDDMATKLAQTESSYNQLKEQILAMESRMAAIEKERERLQQENQQKTAWPLLETAALVLVGGLLGSILMIIIQRRRSRNSYAAPIFDIGDLGTK